MHKPAYPQISNDRSMTSTENAELKKGVGLFKRLKISSLLEANDCLVIFQFQTAKILD